MRWRPRLLRGRLRDQAPVVLVVALVAVAATTLVGVLAGLLHVAERDAAPQALARLAPEQVRLEATLWVRGQDAGPALEDARTGLATLTGDVPSTSSTWLVGSLHALPAQVGTQPQLAYLSALPRPDDVARLLTGTWPDAPTDAQGRVQVTVPQVAAQALGWQVGTAVDARPWGFETTRAWVVVGTYEPAGPRSGWSRDRLRGAGTSTAFNLPGSAGMITTTAWGPLVADAGALAGPEQVDTAYLTVEPRLGDATAAAVTGLRERVRDGGDTLAAAMTGDVRGRLATGVGAAVDATWRELVVMRAGVVTVGLLLATLAAAVMLLTARLLADRRAGEGELLAARGAAPAQLRALVVGEALALAALTWLAAPWLARAVLDVAMRTGPLADAGYRVGAGVPGDVLLACGAMAAVLALTLCAPAWHTTGSTSRSSHTGLLRLGGDLALVVVAGVAVGQLVRYGSPLTGGAAGPRLDPVLVAAPALVALATAMLALRLVGPVARGVETFAQRARSFVGPFAAWQVARRPAVTSGTVLVVVVAVMAGTFSTSLVTTWRTSQVEQVDLALGTDLRADRVEGAALTASDALATATAAYPGAHGQPVVDRTVGVGAAGNGGGVSARLVGLDTTRPQDVRGRGDAPWPTVLEDLVDGEPAPTAGSPLPAGTQWLTVDGVVTTGTFATGGTALVSVTLEDDRGVLTQLPARTTEVGEPFSLTAELPVAGPLRVVAADAVVTITTLPESLAMIPGSARIPLTLALTGVRAVPRDAQARDEQALAGVSATPVVLTSMGWSAVARQSDVSLPGEVTGASAADGGATGGPTGGGAPGFAATGELDVSPWGSTPARLVARAWPDRGPVPAAVTASLLDEVDVVAGGLTVAVGGASVNLQVLHVVEHVPGVPRGAGVVVDRTALSRAVVQAGGSPDLLDAWWVAAPAATAARLADDLGTVDARVTTRAAERDAALAGPVRVAVPAAVSLVAASAALLVLVGTGAVTAASLRARRLELARLQALGASRPGLVGGLVAENLLLLAVGAVVGLLAGYGLAAVVAPLLTTSPDGRTPSPAPWLVWGWGGQSLRTVLVVGVACAVVAAVAVVGVRRTSGAALRIGDDR